MVGVRLAIWRTFLRSFQTDFETHSVSCQSVLAVFFFLAVKRKVARGRNWLSKILHSAFLQECMWILIFSSSCTPVECLSTPALHSALLKELILYIVIRKWTFQNTSMLTRKFENFCVLYGILPAQHLPVLCSADSGQLHREQPHLTVCGGNEDTLGRRPNRSSTWHTHVWFRQFPVPRQL